MKLLNTFFFLIIYLVTTAQTDPIANKSDSVDVVKIIEISSISDETERLNERFTEINQQIQRKEKINSIDSALITISENIKLRTEELEVDTSISSYRKIESEMRRWKVLKEQVYSYKDIVKERSDELQVISDELYEYLKIWESTKEESIKRELNEEVVNSIESVMNTVESIIVVNTDRADSVFLIQKKIAEIVIIIDDVNNQLKLKEHDIRIGYFVIDSPPIWTAKDSTFSPAYVKSLFVNGLKEDKEIFKSYMLQNIPTLILQIVFFLMLIAGMYILRRKEVGKDIDLNNEKGRQFVTVLTNPLSAIIVLGTLVSLFFYRNRPLIFGEFAMWVKE